MGGNRNASGGFTASGGSQVSQPMLSDGDDDDEYFILISILPYCGQDESRLCVTSARMFQEKDDQPD